jgi:hypothetical protein
LRPSKAQLRSIFEEGNELDKNLSAEELTIKLINHKLKTAHLPKTLTTQDLSKAKQKYFPKSNLFSNDPNQIFMKSSWVSVLFYLMLPKSIQNLWTLVLIYVILPITEFIKNQWKIFSDLSNGEKSIVLLTVLFMFICGMTTGGFILVQMAGENPDPAWWQNMVAFIGAIISGNAQKSIFLGTLVEAWGILSAMSFWQFITSGHHMIAFISTICSGFINYAVASFGAEIFIIFVLGISSGPPGWLMLAFAIFFGLMNALLVFSGRIIDLKNNDNKPNSKIMVFICAIVAALTGLIMTFYPGVDELTKTFEAWGLSSTKIKEATAYGTALTILACTLIIEGLYAYKKIIHLHIHHSQIAAPELPEKTSYEKKTGLWNKTCEILNAGTVFFIAAQGGKLFAETCGITVSWAIELLKYVGGALGTLISYSYTIPEPKKESTANTMLYKYKEKLTSSEVSQAQDFKTTLNLGSS